MKSALDTCVTRHTEQRSANRLRRLSMSGISILAHALAIALLMQVLPELPVAMEEPEPVSVIRLEKKSKVLEESEPTPEPEPPEKPVEKPVVEDTFQYPEFDDEPIEPTLPEIPLEHTSPIERPLPEPMPTAPSTLTPEVINPPPPVLPPPESEVTRPVKRTEFPRPAPETAPAPEPAPQPVTPGTPVLVAPKPLSRPEPQYPRSARQRGYEGRVVLNVVVGVNGRVKSATVKRSSGYSVLDKAAQKKVLEWIFFPGSRDGQNHEVSTDVTIRFELN